MCIPSAANSQTRPTYLMRGFEAMRNDSGSREGVREFLDRTTPQFLNTYGTDQSARSASRHQRPPDGVVWNDAELSPCQCDQYRTSPLQ